MPFAPGRDTMNGGRVLVVEDEPLIRRLLVTVLEREGIDLEETGNGAEALALIFSGRFQVVLLDLTLPGMSGYEILERCAASLLPPRPVFLVTTAFDARSRRPLDPHLVTAVLAKPVDPGLLAELIREMARTRCAGQGASGAGYAFLPGAQPPVREPTA